jgi:hypothetical protein
VPLSQVKQTGPFKTPTKVVVPPAPIVQETYSCLKYGKIFH